jgi:hypothetical protein
MYLKQIFAKDASWRVAPHFYDWPCLHTSERYNRLGKEIDHVSFSIHESTMINRLECTGRLTYIMSEFENQYDHHYTAIYHHNEHLHLRWMRCHAEHCIETSDESENALLDSAPLKPHSTASLWLRGTPRVNSDRFISKPTVPSAGVPLFHYQTFYSHYNLSYKSKS